MPGSVDRILTTHVGSLVRPPQLVEFLRRIEAGEPYDATAYEACLSDCIGEAVRQQAEAGVDIVSDGEFGKGINWAFYVHRRMSGLQTRPMTAEERADPLLTPAGGPDRAHFAAFYKEYEAVGFTRGEPKRPVCTGKLVYTGYDQVERDIANLKRAVQEVGGVSGFLPVVAPASALPHAKDEYYGSEEAFLTGIAEALREEYRTIAESGLIVQIDDAFLTTQYERMVPPMSVDEYRRWVERRIEALNHALDGIPREQTRYHICWGSWNGPHVYDVPMQTIVDLVLRVRVGGYLFEAANPRHAHEWRVWETIKPPEGSVLIPGVISHATNVVEHPELVAERLVRLANLVGRENVMAGTDCGFAQSPFLQRVHPQIVWAKLRALAEGARLASKTLWGRT